MGRKSSFENASKPTLKSLRSSAQHDPVSIALKRLHDDVTSEEVPDDFLSILAAIDRKIASGEDSQ